MGDIVERLRKVCANPIYLSGVPGTIPGSVLAREAADEIERLRAVITEAIPFIGYQAHVPDILARAEKAVAYEEAE
jgi:hypothetical protein